MRTLKWIRWGIGSRWRLQSTGVSEKTCSRILGVLYFLEDGEPERGATAVWTCWMHELESLQQKRRGMDGGGPCSWDGEMLFWCLIRWPKERVGSEMTPRSRWLDRQWSRRRRRGSYRWIWWAIWDHQDNFRFVCDCMRCMFLCHIFQNIMISFKIYTFTVLGKKIVFSHLSRVASLFLIRNLRTTTIPFSHHSYAYSDGFAAILPLCTVLSASEI